MQQPDILCCNLLQLQVHSQVPPVGVSQLLASYGHLGLPQGSHALLAALLQQLAGHVASLRPE
jgi:hypothetical protein